MKKPIQEAKDSDVRGALAAMQRAAADARKIAKATGTAVVYMKDGKIVKEYIR